MSSLKATPFLFPLSHQPSKLSDDKIHVVNKGHSTRFASILIKLLKRKNYIANQQNPYTCNVGIPPNPTYCYQY